MDQQAHDGRVWELADVAQGLGEFNDLATEFLDKVKERSEAFLPGSCRMVTRLSLTWKPMLVDRPELSIVRQPELAAGQWAGVFPGGATCGRVIF